MDSYSISFPYLRELRLDHNKLNSLNSKIFDPKNMLEILDLSHNPLQSFEEDTMEAIISLVHLKVSKLYLFSKK